MIQHPEGHFAHKLRPRERTVRSQARRKLVQRNSLWNSRSQIPARTAESPGLMLDARSTRVVAHPTARIAFLCETANDGRLQTAIQRQTEDPMALSSTKRALIAVAIIVCVAALACAIYIHRARQPLPELPVASNRPAPGVLDELPADAPAITFIDVAALRKLQNSPLAGLIGLTGTAPSQSSGEQMDPDYAQFVHGTGFDYTRDLDQAAVAFWPSDLSPNANAAGDNPALAIADGRFDQRKIVSYALRVGGRGENAKGRTRYIVPGKPTVAFEFLSPTRIAIASGKHAADLLNLPVQSTPSPDMQTRIKRVSGAPIFGVARTDRLPASFYAAFKNSPQLEHLVRGIQGLTLSGQPDEDRIHVVLDADCDSMTNAFEISTLLDGFRLIGTMSLSDPNFRRQAQMTPQQAAFLEALVKQAQVSHQGRSVRIKLDITPAMLGQSPERGAKER
jgi:hypothetical protein